MIIIKVVAVPRLVLSEGEFELGWSGAGACRVGGDCSQGAHDLHKKKALRRFERRLAIVKILG